MSLRISAVGLKNLESRRNDFLLINALNVPVLAILSTMVQLVVLLLYTSINERKTKGIII